MGRARGKLKYKDVVRGGTQKKKNNKNRIKPRKTYSLYAKDKKNNDRKRKFHPNRSEEEPKRQKFEEQPKIQLESSGSEEEVEDHLKQLRQTFGSGSKKIGPIDSEDSEVESEGKEASDNDETDKEDENVLSDDQEQISDEEIVDTSKDPENGDDPIDNAKDPFVKHLLYDLHEDLLDSLQSIPMKIRDETLNWPVLGRLLIQLPNFEDVVSEKSEFSIEDEKKFTNKATLPVKIDAKSLKPTDLFIKSQIIVNLEKANNSVATGEVLNQFQGEMFSILNNYQDMLYCERTFSNAEQIRFVYCLHAVNHILKTRMKIVHHNARLAKKDEVPEDFRDQGLARPKILIIVPFKDAAFRVIKMIIDILLPQDKGTIMYKKRFFEEYTGNELVMPKRNPKPEDYESTFTGNTNDDFRIGLTITKKSLKLFADFYSSDIIVASPLGLRTVIGAEGEAERDFDFLASIELLILDQTDLFLMQNWDHLMHIFNHLHLQPKEAHGTNFSRVRTWSLNGWAKYYRQTVILSSVNLPEINSIFNKKCFNHAGKVKISNPVELGTISQVVVQLPHVFHKFETKSVQQAIDARFDFFVGKILPQQRDSLMKQTLIYVANYFDYVRLRNYFKKEEIGFVQICEYSKDGKIARARDMFYHGDAHFLLYTERYHFFNRIRMKGIRHIVFYQPPSFPHFYYEMCNLMQEANMNKKVGNMSNMTVSVLYSKYDIHQLSAIVSTDRAVKMVESPKSVHMMVTGAD